ncbi:AbiH family protein [Erysipelothrix aquatica]|uniref:AbiH family protein n=1 Tax=Erysipelothrix aquatica TaxID=2683714 RepID=UPI00135B94EE|nr:AbiH family protein [Erysipelothrix aquatica]
MNVIVLGNGFDLFHDIETSFSSFKIFLEEYIKDPGNPKYDNNIRQSMIDGFISDHDVKEMYNFIEIITNNREVDKLYPWNSFEQDFLNYCISLSDSYKRSYPAAATTKMNTGILYPLSLSTFDSMKKSHSAFSYCFQGYLRSLGTDYSFYQQFQSVFAKADLIITFNYTHTYAKYLAQNTKAKIVHIHGNMENTNSITIGFQHIELEEIKKGDNYLNDIDYSADYFFKENLLSLKEDIALSKRIQELEPFFGKVSRIDFLGWSFSKIDSYFSEVILKLISFPKEGLLSKEEMEKIGKAELYIYRHPEYDAKDYLRQQLTQLIVSSSSSPGNELKVMGSRGIHPIANFIQFEEVDYKIIKESEEAKEGL